MDAISTLPPSAIMDAKKTAQINRTAEDFEAVFLSQMMEHMFADIDLDPTAEAPGEDIYKSMMVDEYGKIFAKSGGIGVADYVRETMLNQQENDSWKQQ